MGCPKAPEGATVKFTHRRKVAGSETLLTGREMAEKKLRPEPKGGSTMCYLEIDGKTYHGVAITYYKDNFNRRIGRDVSLGRALALLKGGPSE